VEGLAHAVRHIQLSQSSEIRTLLPVLLALPALGVMVQHRAAVKPFRIAILAMLFVLALQDALYQLLFAVSAPLLLAEAVASALAQHGLPRRVPARPAAVFIVLAVLAVAVRVMIPIERSDGPDTPGTAFEHVPATLARSAVLNDIAFGGYLIFHDVRPFIDNRLLYSPSVRARYVQITRPDRAVLAAMLTKHHVHWTIFTPANPAVAAMDGLQGWHRLYADRWAVVHVRNGEP
jgi:putative Ca2+/H+ antiporter (TMEM165/GDT1 family)